MPAFKCCSWASRNLSLTYSNRHSLPSPSPANTSPRKETELVTTCAIILVSAYSVSYLIIYYLLGGFYPEMVRTEGGSARLKDFILYNLIFLVLLIILRNLLPSDFTPVLFLMVYLPWMAYRGTDHLYVKKDKVTKFVIISSALLLLMPIAIKAFIELFVVK